MLKTIMPGIFRAFKNLIFGAFFFSLCSSVYWGDSNKNKKFRIPTTSESPPTAKNGLAYSVSVENCWYIQVPTRSPKLALVAQNPISTPLPTLGNHLLSITKLMAHPGDCTVPLIILTTLYIQKCYLGYWIRIPRVNMDNATITNIRRRRYCFGYLSASYPVNIPPTA